MSADDRGLILADDHDVETSALMLKAALRALSDYYTRNAGDDGFGWHVTVTAWHPASRDGEVVVAGNIMGTRDDALTIQPSEDGLTSSGYPTTIPWERIIRVEVS